MEPIIISASKQTFNGLAYYWGGSKTHYFQRSDDKHSYLLHRVVWQHHNGSIPANYHIHHKDEDRSNNSPSNLEKIRNGDHTMLHLTPVKREAARRRMIEVVSPHAKAWHRSKAGLAWHSKHSKENAKKWPWRTYKCTQCGKEFKSRDIRSRPKRFCNYRCKLKHAYWLKRST